MSARHGGDDGRVGSVWTDHSATSRERSEETHKMDGWIGPDKCG